MLWFNIGKCFDGRSIIKISIHLMLWFNIEQFRELGLLTEFQYILCCGSTLGRESEAERILEFQYILCCGSTISGKNFFILSSYFNTSYVVVQRIPRMQTHPRNGISIHLMLWFNFFILSSSIYLSNFNTSYVVVQPCLW